MIINPFKSHEVFLKKVIQLGHDGPMYILRGDKL